ncbi:hypothetical protein PV408_45960, partial [Streptomyces sp. ME18-1-4]|nr:hypothetical protein [Streptomyces sp. ME18-1-4]
MDPTGRQGPPGQRGLPCPQCGALRAPDNTPSCWCAQRAAESLRDTRTAEAAAAEDFDPLRIRPYVELEGQQPPAEGGGGCPASSRYGRICSGTKDSACSASAVPGAGRKYASP